MSAEYDQMVADILDDAADLLEKKGWTRGALVVWGRHCSIGAIHAVTKDEGMRYRAREALVRSLAANNVSGFVEYSVHPVDHCSSIIKWNDRHETTSRLVLDSFRKAAKEARQNE